MTLNVMTMPNFRLKIAFASVGKLGASAAFAVVYNYSAEIFPTVVRNSGLGMSSSIARLGSISAPQIALLGTYVFTWLPYVIFGTVAALGALLVCLLPETEGLPMPETIQDGVDLTSGRSSRKLPYGVVESSDNEKEQFV